MITPHVRLNTHYGVEQMSTVISISDAAANLMLDEIARAVDNGQINVYSGTPPADVGTALAGNTLLAECQLSATSAPPATGRTLTFTPPSDDTSNNNNGTASFYRIFDAAGTTAVVQGTCGTSGESMTMVDTVLVAGGTLEITSVIIVMP